MEYKNILQVDCRKSFREWLSVYSDQEIECWVNVKRGKPVDDTHFWYIDAVEEALCYGWIDSLAGDSQAAKDVAEEQKKAIDDDWDTTGGLSSDDALSRMLDSALNSVKPKMERAVLLSLAPSLAADKSIDDVKGSELEGLKKAKEAYENASEETKLALDEQAVHDGYENFLAKLDAYILRAQELNKLNLWWLIILLAVMLAAECAAIIVLALKKGDKKDDNVEKGDKETKTDNAEDNGETS